MSLHGGAQGPQLAHSVLGTQAVVVVGLGVVVVGFLVVVVVEVVLVVVVDVVGVVVVVVHLHPSEQVPARKLMGREGTGAYEFQTKNNVVHFFNYII